MNGGKGVGSDFIGTPYTYTIEGNAIAIVAKSGRWKSEKDNGPVVWWIRPGYPLREFGDKGTALGVPTDIDKFSLSFTECQCGICVFS
ncbi:MAG: hypothetical protein ACLUDU_07355 [Butyricimonas faecihominis]